MCITQTYSGPSKIGIKNRRLKAEWDNDYLERLLIGTYQFECLLFAWTLGPFAVALLTEKVTPLFF